MNKRRSRDIFESAPCESILFHQIGRTVHSTAGSTSRPFFIAGLPAAKEDIPNETRQSGARAAAGGLLRAGGGLLGAARGYADPGDTEGKKRLYAEVQELAEAFRKENGSIICRELLGVAGAESPVPEARTAEYYKKRPCPELCAAAARILAEKLSIPDENNALQ